MITTRASSSKAAALGDAETSPSLTALSNHETMSCGYFSLFQVYVMLVAQDMEVYDSPHLVFLTNLTGTK
jgi:hypothetical protein